ncbi:Hint domain-containing protein [Streptomyces sp. NPDC050523]|uniref:Hint domain-containing protein n=1 Tax=Streptomyces sp. NPDC050523 TaxID=3365622 RepID=UPI0037B8F3DC
MGIGHEAGASWASGGETGGGETGGGETGCFVRGTLVATENGVSPIEQIAVGDKVQTYDFDRRGSKLEKVIRVFESPRDEIVVIESTGGDVSCTPRHRFYVNRWTAAEDLKRGDVISCREGQRVEIVGIRQKVEPQLVYNLAVEGSHNYFVGELGLLVHNAKKSDPGEGSPDERHT